MREFREEKEDWVLKVENVKKKFSRSLRRSMLYAMYDMFSIIFKGSINPDKMRDSEFLALKGVSFSLNRGESLGIIGLNGSGKSTLLRIIAGIYPPSHGRVSVRGRIGALIAVGAGFHDQMSGRDNIYLNGSILGMSREEIEREFNNIVEFAELGDFLEAPVQTYSSGMRVRLGFSIAVHSDIDILIADEVLAVGDSSFRMKSHNKIGELRERGVTIILVSHDTFTITGSCEKGLYIDKGEVKYFGDVHTATSLYQKSIIEKKKEVKEKKEINYKDFLLFEKVSPILTFTDIELSCPFRNGFLEIKSNEDLRISFYYEALEDYKGLSVNYNLMMDNLPKAYSRLRSSDFNNLVDIKKGKGILSLVIKKINLNMGYGILTSLIATEGKKENFAYLDNLPIKIISEEKQISLDTVSLLDYEISLEDLED